MNHVPLFSIISVCYNCQDKVIKTIRSLKEQDFPDYEYLVVDGASTDRTLERVKEATADMERVVVISEKDSGIYDAMNKGVQAASGKYLFFLNMGDTFFDRHVLSSFAKAMGDEKDLYYGNVCRSDGKEIDQKGKASLRWAIYREYMISHQSLFAKRSLLLADPFHTMYHVCADREWLIRVLKRGVSVEHLPVTVCNFETDGISSEYEMFEKESMAISCHYGSPLTRWWLIIKRCFRKR